MFNDCFQDNTYNVFEMILLLCAMSDILRVIYFTQRLFNTEMLIKNENCESTIIEFYGNIHIIYGYL